MSSSTVHDYRRELEDSYRDQSVLQGLVYRGFGIIKEVYLFILFLRTCTAAINCCYFACQYCTTLHLVLGAYVRLPVELSCPPAPMFRLRNQH
jgi:hypothetical protein